MNKEIFCFADDFTRLVKDHDNQNMIIYDDGVSTKYYSYKDVCGIMAQYFALFKKYNIKRNDTIVSLLPNSADTIICFFAAVISGINYAPLPCTSSEREIENWMALTKGKMLLKKSGNPRGEKYKSITITTGCKGDFSWLPDEKCIENYADDAKIFLQTSGTTGDPKAMVIDINKLWSSGKAFVNFYDIENSEYRFWNYLPMSYLGGLFNLALIPLCCGGSFLISEPFSGKTVLNYWNTVKRYKLSALWMVPSIVSGLLKISKLVGKANKDICDSYVKIMFLGTAPIHYQEKEKFEETFGIKLYENFALSETTFLTAEDNENMRYREEGSVGRVLPYVELKIDDLDGVNDGGNILVKTPFMFDGYLSSGGTLLVELDNGGYFNTKDIGHFNDDKVLVLSGRSRDIIKKGGRFISLAEIEALVSQLDYVEEASGVPIKHDFYGESYVLYIIPKQDKQSESFDAELTEWLSENLVPYKMPEKIIMCNEFPRTPSGKIKKGEMEEQYYAKQ